MINKSATPSKFNPLKISQSPVAASPNKNLTGTARVVRDLTADFFNNIQHWNSLHIKGAEVVKQIAALKADLVDEYSDGLEEYTTDLFNIIQNLKSQSDQLHEILSKISALCKIDNKQENIFISLCLRDIVTLMEHIVNGYFEEFKIKQLVLENIAHSNNKDDLMFFAASWTYQPNITKEITFKMETLLVETGHRKVS